MYFKLSAWLLGVNILQQIHESNTDYTFDHHNSFKIPQIPYDPIEIHRRIQQQVENQVARIVKQNNINIYNWQRYPPSRPGSNIGYPNYHLKSQTPHNIDFVPASLPSIPVPVMLQRFDYPFKRENTYNPPLNGLILIPSEFLPVGREKVKTMANLSHVQKRKPETKKIAQHIFQGSAVRPTLFSPPIEPIGLQDQSPISGLKLILGGRFPPRIEQFVQRIQNRYSTYNNLAVVLEKPQIQLVTAVPESTIISNETVVIENEEVHESTTVEVETTESSEVSTEEFQTTVTPVTSVIKETDTTTDLETTTYIQLKTDEYIIESTTEDVANETTAPSTSITLRNI